MFGSKDMAFYEEWCRSRWSPSFCFAGADQVLDSRVGGVDALLVLEFDMLEPCLSITILLSFCQSVVSCSCSSTCSTSHGAVRHTLTYQPPRRRNLELRQSSIYILSIKSLFSRLGQWVLFQGFPFNAYMAYLLRFFFNAQVGTLLYSRIFVDTSFLWKRKKWSCPWLAINIYLSRILLNPHLLHYEKWWCFDTFCGPSASKTFPPRGPAHIESVNKTVLLKSTMEI